jgi:hypothetical protein
MWDWLAVSAWLESRGQIDHSAVVEASVVRRINTRLEFETRLDEMNYAEIRLSA